MKLTLFLTVLLLAPVAALPASDSLKPAAAEKPNILVILGKGLAEAMAKLKQLKPIK